MRRRIFLRHATAWLAASSAYARLRTSAANVTESVVSSDADRMNVLFIHAAGLSTAALRCFDNPLVETPHLDRFAAGTVRFLRCYCQAPTPDLSRSSFLTGLRPGTGRTWADSTAMGRFLPPGIWPLTKLLAEAGIHTVELGGRPDKTPALSRQAPSSINDASGPTQEQDRDERRADLTAHTLSQMTQEREPFFMSLPLQQPGASLRCPRKYVDLYDLMYIPAPNAPAEQDKQIPTIAKRSDRRGGVFHDRHEGPITSKAAREAVLAYYACASFVDAQIGSVLQALEEAHLADHTIVLIFGDHGFQLGEHGLWGAATLFEQCTRVPLLVRIPGTTDRGTACDEIVELVDLVPTLCGLLQVAAPEHLEGTSLVPLLSEPVQPWKKAAFTTCVKYGDVGFSVRTKRWRYTDWTSLHTGAHRFELYDLDTDPWEQTNLVHDPGHRNERTILANLLQRRWRGAQPPADATAPPVTKFLSSP